MREGTIHAVLLQVSLVQLEVSVLGLDQLLKGVVLRHFASHFLHAHNLVIQICLKLHMRQSDRATFAGLPQFLS